MWLELCEIDKAFDDKPVLQSVSLSLEVGEIVVLLGPSGCGKTTLLRIIAGLESADRGRLLLDGHDLTPVPVHQRGFGFLFQDYALFPHKDVFQNIAFGLQMLHCDKACIEERVGQVLALVGLTEFARQPIHELSGGEQQRVALARSLAPTPRLLLFDEPLGALDRALRERLMIELRTILKKAGGLMDWPDAVTALYVTHDQTEAFAIADRVIVMNQGRIIQTGTPTQLYHRPATPFVARFLGMENLYVGQLLSRDPYLIRTELGELEAAPPVEQMELQVGDQVTLLVRPEAGELVDAGEDTLNGHLQAVSFRGRYQIATIRMTGPEPASSLKLEFDSGVSLPAPGSPINIRLKPQTTVLLKSC
jgi:ABC-type Fe3+/spermidine/putrescine transport system ATPase subunit